MSLKVYGHSDDLIEVEGDIDEEFPATSGNRDVIAFSDGTVIAIAFSDKWYIYPVVEGALFEGVVYGEDTDTANFKDGITWVVQGSAITRVRK